MLHGDSCTDRDSTGSRAATSFLVIWLAVIYISEYRDCEHVPIITHYSLSLCSMGDCWADCLGIRERCKSYFWGFWL